MKNSIIMDPGPPWDEKILGRHKSVFNKKLKEESGWQEFLLGRTF